jgi:hypothetical protein
LNPFRQVRAAIRKNSNSRRQLIHETYQIEGLMNLDRNPVYLDPLTYPNFKTKLVEYKELLLELNLKNIPASFYKFGDGDYYFLRGLPSGSAKPGNRALSRSLTHVELEKFRDNSVTSDYYSCELYPENIGKFKEVFPTKNLDFPAEFSYICVASNWYIRNLKNVGIIGADSKIKLIKELCNKDEYLNKLGFDGFTSFISIPQKYSCDNLDEQLESLREQLSNANSEVFLVGIGHLKSGVLGLLKQYKKSIYIDVGSGIDALAGVVDTERPYFGNWTNYQLLNYDYSSLDLLSFNEKNIEYLG